MTLPEHARMSVDRVCDHVSDVRGVTTLSFFLNIPGWREFGGERFVVHGIHVSWVLRVAVDGDEIALPVRVST